MNFNLSCGPILEPLIGISISSVILVFAIIYIIKITIKSNFYQNEFVAFNNSRKIILIVLYFAILSSTLIILFFILTFIISGILLL